MGHPWVLPDGDLDRQLRGRLPVINKQMAHLSWDRITDQNPTMWATTFLAHEITYALVVFVDDLQVSNSQEHLILTAAHKRVLAVLPKWADTPQTPVTPAPPRRPRGTA